MSVCLDRLWKLKIALPKTLFELDDANAILVAGYIFAEKIQDDSFTDNVRNVLMAASSIKIDGESANLDSDQMSLIYRQTPPASPIRNFVLGEYVWFGCKQPFDDLARSLLPVDFCSISEFNCSVSGRHPWQRLQVRRLMAACTTSIRVAKIATSTSLYANVVDLSGLRRSFARHENGS